VWVANRQDATVSRIDPATDAVTGLTPVGRDPRAIAAKPSRRHAVTASWRIGGRADRRSERSSGTSRPTCPSPAPTAAPTSSGSAQHPLFQRRTGPATGLPRRARGGVPAPPTGP
jgi:YVTN family beta-propeller protein